MSAALSSNLNIIPGCVSIGSLKCEHMKIDPAWAFRIEKEQVIYGRVYRNLEEVRQAVSDFLELYNSQWLPKKNRYLSPADASKAYYEGKAA